MRTNERMHELKAQVLIEKIDHLVESLNSEKDGRDSLLEKFEKEQNEHTVLHTELL